MFLIDCVKAENEDYLLDDECTPYLIKKLIDENLENIDNNKFSNLLILMFDDHNESYFIDDENEDDDIKCIIEDADNFGIIGYVYTRVDDIDTPNELTISIANYKNDDIYVGKASVSSNLYATDKYSTLNVDGEPSSLLNYINDKRNSLFFKELTELFCEISSNAINNKYKIEYEYGNTPYGQAGIISYNTDEIYDIFKVDVKEPYTIIIKEKGNVIVTTYLTTAISFKDNNFREKCMKNGLQKDNLLISFRKINDEPYLEYGTDEEEAFKSYRYIKATKNITEDKVKNMMGFLILNNISNTIMYLENQVNRLRKKYEL